MPHILRGRLACLHTAKQAVTCATGVNGDIKIGAKLAPAVRTEQQHQSGLRREPSRPRSLPGRRSLGQMGGRNIAERGPNAEFRPKGQDLTAREIGWRRSKRQRKAQANTGQERISTCQNLHGRLRSYIAGDSVFEATAMACRMIGPSSRMDGRLVFAEARGRCAEGALHSPESTRRRRLRVTTLVSRISGFPTQGAKGGCISALPNYCRRFVRPRVMPSR